MCDCSDLRRRKAATCMERRRFCQRDFCSQVRLAARIFTAKTFPSRRLLFHGGAVLLVRSGALLCDSRFVFLIRLLQFADRVFRFDVQIIFVWIAKHHLRSDTRGKGHCLMVCSCIRAVFLCTLRGLRRSCNRPSLSAAARVFLRPCRRGRLRFFQQGARVCDGTPSALRKPG